MVRTIREDRDSLSRGRDNPIEPSSLARVRIEDMRLFAEVAAAQSFTGAARRLGVPKQTLSRRVAELEASLDVQLLHRTTRRLHLTDAGAVYAARCAEMVRLAEDANRVLTEGSTVPRGVLRVTADPLFGEAFLGPLLVEYAEAWPEVGLDVMLTRRRVDLVEEGFDVAFRIGPTPDAGLSATRLGPAHVRFCASPAYLARRGAPREPDDLDAHECIVVASEDAAARWPFRGHRGPTLRPVRGRLRMNSSALAHVAARAGLGIALFPEFACAEDLRAGTLRSVLDAHAVEVGGVWVVHPIARYPSARARAFVELAVARLGDGRAWTVSAPRARKKMKKR